MDEQRFFNLLIGCVLGSELTNESKQEVINKFVEIEEERKEGKQCR